MTQNKEKPIVKPWFPEWKKTSRCFAYQMCSGHFRRRRAHPGFAVLVARTFADGFPWRSFRPSRPDRGEHREGRQPLQQRGRGQETETPLWKKYYDRSWTAKYYFENSYGLKVCEPCWEYAAFTPSKIGIKVQGPFNVTPSINLGLWLIPEAPSSQFWVVNFCRWIPSTSRAGSCINKPRSSINLRLEITKRSVFTILTMTDKLSSSQVAGQWTVGKYGFRRNKLFNS